MAKVSVVKCEDYKDSYAAVKQAVDLVGGLKIPKGSKVLVKPNVLGPEPPEKAITTNPAIVDARQWHYTPPAEPKPAV